MIEVLKAIVLGIIEGFTEFLPISSTGHLIVAEDVINYKDTAEIFTVVIQVGAIAAVIWLYRHDLINKIIGLYKKEPITVKFWINWVVATIPAGLIGFLLKDTITEYAVATTVAIALIVGGIAIWLIETYHKNSQVNSVYENLDKIKLSQAVKIGFYQVFALIPGVSRSGATIMGGLLSGMSRVQATAFSFYLSIPILILAGGYQLISGRNELGTIQGGALGLIIGTIVSFFTALLAIKWLLKYVSSHDFKFFAYYRIIFGIIILLLIV